MAGGTRTDLQQRVLDHDWAATPLGAVGGWSPTVRATVGNCLNSRFPMVFMVGSELVMVYNDAYAPMLGARHPAALGAPLAEVWSDIWPTIGPMVAGVQRGQATYSEDLPLAVTRDGFVEDTWFTFSFSPVVEPGGVVAGVLDTAVESTDRVLAARRLALLQRLAARLPLPRRAGAADICSVALSVLAEHPDDVPFAAAYLSADEGALPELVASSGFAGGAALAGHEVTELVRRTVVGGAVVPVEHVREQPGQLSLFGVRSTSAVEPGLAVLVPLAAAGQDTSVGALLLGVNPRLRLDDAYRGFLTLLAGQVGAVVAEAQAVDRERRLAGEATELEQARGRFFAEVAVTLQRSVLGPTTLPAGFAVHYEPATEMLEVGGDWYDVVDLPGGRYGVVVGDVVGRGLPSAAVMGQLRSAARASLLESRSPAQVLETLDRFAALVPGATCSTVFCGVVDPAEASLHYSSAGHLPAVLVAADGAPLLLERGRGLPLAVAEGVLRGEAEQQLGPGSTLLLYTDGLVERRDEVLDEGIERAARALSEGRHLPPAQLADLLTDQLLEDDREDDVAFLLYRTAG